MVEEVWQPDGMAAAKNPEDFFNVREAQGHLLIVWVRDEVLNFATKDCPDGWKLLMRGPNKGKSVPNNVVRATIADLSVPGEDGAPGKVFEEAVIFAGTLVKDLKYNVGKKLLLVWKQHDPSDKSSPYSYQLMNENTQAVQIAQEFTSRHPEFWSTPAPAPYQISQRQEAEQPTGNQGQSQGTQANWAQPDPWAQQVEQVQQGYQRAAQVVQQAAQGNGSFLSQVQNQPEFLQHQPNKTSHHGTPQTEEPPF